MNASVQPVKGTILMYPKKVVLHFFKAKPEAYQLCLLRSGVIRSKDIIYYAAKAAHVPESTVKLAGEAMFDAINYFCANGHAVQIPGLGSFGMQFNAKVAKTEDDATAERIERKYVRFWPKHDIRNLCSLKNIGVEVKDLLRLKEPAESTEPDAPAEP